MKKSVSEIGDFLSYVVQMIANYFLSDEVFVSM